MNRDDVVIAADLIHEQRDCMNLLERIEEGVPLRATIEPSYAEDGCLKHAAVVEIDRPTARRLVRRQLDDITARLTELGVED